MEKTNITETPLIGLLDKIGQLIILGVCWIIGSLPVVTLGTSTTALYYAVIKSIRRGQGYALGEFWKSYKANLRRGILATVIMLFAAGLLCLNLWTLQQAEQDNTAMMLANGLCLAVLCISWIYLCPVLSRFTMGVANAWKLAFVMAIRFLPQSILLAAGVAVLAALQIWILPVPTALLIPGLWCYVTTFVIEKVLRKYMPAKKENDDAWYYE